MSLLDRLIRAGLAALTAHLAPPRTYGGNAGLYLSRWTLLDAGKRRWRLCLHHFHRSDEVRELHTHPWSWAIAFQLAGGYREERRERCAVRGDVVRAHVRRPGHVVVLRADTAHRVDVLDEGGGSWSLILTGPVVASWGFWDRETGRETPWRDFIQQKGLVPMDAAAPERPTPLAPNAYFCQGCGSADACQAGCPEAAAIASAEAQILAEEDAARLACATQGHVPGWSQCDPFSRDADYICSRCGVPLPEPEDDGGAS